MQRGGPSGGGHRCLWGALPQIQAMVADGKTPKEIDHAVKIDDKPAIEGLATLRGK